MCHVNNQVMETMQNLLCPLRAVPMHLKLNFRSVTAESGRIAALAFCMSHKHVGDS